jgi:hypothetical protein
MNTVANPVDPREHDHELVLDWVQGVPDGLLAYAPLPASGVYQRDSHDRPKFTRIRLRSTDAPAEPSRPAGLLADSDWNWITRSARAWTSIVQRFRGDANHVAVALARAGCVTIEHDLNVSTLIQPPRRLHPHPALATKQANALQRRRDETAALRAQAITLATALADEWPGVAAALGSVNNPERLTWAVNAATDLADGRTHDSLRAFAQFHAGRTKARDDVNHLLAELGFESEAIATLGLARNPYIGLGGPFQLHTSTHVLDLIGLPGPHDIRLPAGHNITLRLPTRAPILLVIENRQASETGCDAHPDLPVIWCHGQPPDAVLHLIAQAAQRVDTVMICPDADLGGVRIAARIHDHLRPDIACRILDIGNAEHLAGTSFNTHSRTHLAALAERTDQVGRFARDCLNRGYGIEQEAAARVTLRHAVRATQTNDSTVNLE